MWSNINPLSSSQYCDAADVVSLALHMRLRHFEDGVPSGTFSGSNHSRAACQRIRTRVRSAGQCRQSAGTKRPRPKWLPNPSESGPSIGFGNVISSMAPAASG